jgi:hypothetical protein
MKVYELMSLLEDCASGAEIRVNIAITKKELEYGSDIGEGVFTHSLTAASVTDDNDRIYIETNAPGR